MRFKLNATGEMVLMRRNPVQEMADCLPLTSAFVLDLPKIKENIKHMKFSKGKAFSIALPVLGVVATGGSGVFWSAFMQYIFPWMLDIAKVLCAIKIAQAFYEEKRGGRDGGNGFGALVTYGKWYLIFWLIPWGVELIDQIGGKMLNDLRSGGL